jgi:N-formylglutamate amidohydrolase
LDEFGVANILDCHSFSDKPFQRDLDQNSFRPDICIGTDKFHTPSRWITYAYKLFTSNGFSVKIDNPYEGTFVPSHHLHQTKEVRSMMIEVNRKLYLKEDSNEFLEKIDHKLGGVIAELVRGISFLGSSGKYLD